MNKETITEDIIEISDDSGDGIDYGAGTSGAGSSSKYKMKNPPFGDHDEDDDSDESDDVQFIEEESEEEPDCECDTWDDDCLVLQTAVTTKPLKGIHHVKFISPPCPEEGDAKRLKLSVEMNDNLSDEQFFKSLQENYLNDNAFEEKNCELICDPWKVLVINNLLADVAILDKVRQEFNELGWNIRTMDLYEFSQSEDLKDNHDEHITMVYDFLKGDLLDWVSKLTSIDLVSVSATCSFYSDTDFLLVHDDQQDTRAVAFVLYLTGKEGWCIDWGGSLQLLNCDENKQPLDVARNIQPRNNQLVLFPVSDKSYHQVEEVQCKDVCRLSINGWFHTKEPLTFEAPHYIPPIDGLYGLEMLEPIDLPLNLELGNQTHTEDNNHAEKATDEENKNKEVELLIKLKDYIDEGYLVEETVNSIQRYIEEHSEMSLDLYFNEDKFKALYSELQKWEIDWKPMRPSNRRKYEYLSHTTPSSDLDRCPTLGAILKILRSSEFFQYLDQYTGLNLKTMKWELQKWTPGSYSLITQDNLDRLDLMFCIGDTDIVGGKTHYVTLEDEVQTALITTGCDVNYLNLVYGDTARYTSLISKYSKSKCFYMFIASYYEKQHTQSNNK